MKYILQLASRLLYLRHAFAREKAFYYISKIGETTVFNKYNPVTKATEQITFPKVEKETFVGFKAIFNVGGIFLFLTEYSGSRKYGPTIRCFL